MESVDFSFVFCRFVRFYGMTDGHVLNMPIRRFWYMEQQLERVRAQELSIQIPLMQCGMGGEHVKEYHHALQERVGQVADVRSTEYVRTSDDDKKRLAALSSSSNKAR